MNKVSFDAIELKQGQDKLISCVLPASALATISYVAARGKSDEEGAVQRLLNPKRISGIKNYILGGGTFPNNVVLNWVEPSKISFEKSKLTISIEPGMAQILDGQHRIAGLKEAIKSDPLIGDMFVPAVIAVGLNTEKCAKIFLSINTEQKTVPKSLMYDLYGLIPEYQGRDYAIDRATDIAEALNEEEDSPYSGLIKFPGVRMRGGIQLSTAIQTLKPLVKRGGDFERYNISNLENQVKVIKNFFNAIKKSYGKMWETTKNPFMMASGFASGIEVLSHPVLQHCFSKKDFSASIFENIIVLSKDKPILQEIVKGQGGDAARAILKSRLLEGINIGAETENEFKF